MEILNQILLILFLTLSPILGFFLAKYTKEEQKSLKTYISVAFLVILILLNAVIITLNSGSIYLFLLFYLLGALLSLFIKNYFFYLGIIFFSIIKVDLNFLFIISVLIFLLNIILGTIFYQKNNKLKEIKIELVFFLIPIIIYALSFKISNLYALSGIGLGAIISLLLKQKNNKGSKISKTKVAGKIGRK